MPPRRTVWAEAVNERMSSFPSARFFIVQTVIGSRRRIGESCFYVAVPPRDRIRSADNMEPPTRSLSLAFIRSLSSARKNPGMPLPAKMRQEMEAAFKARFDDVRVRISPLPWSLKARAFALNDDLYFAPGEYDCTSEAGLRLLGHELTHILQQRAGRAQLQSDPGFNLLNDPALEDEAEWRGWTISRSVRPAVTAPQLQQAPFSYEISHPHRIRKDSYSIDLSTGGKQAGGITIHLRNRSTVELANLTITPALRKRGLGRMLIDSALRLGMRCRRASAVLTSHDCGDGRLTKWYQAMGFYKAGYDRHYPQLEGKIGEVLMSLAASKPLGTSRFTRTLCWNSGPAGFCGETGAIQCMDDESRRRRAERFKPQLDAMATERAASEANINHLRQLVALLKGAIFEEGSISVEAHGGRATVHGYGDPAGVFRGAFQSAHWNTLEGNLSSDGSQLTVTVRMENRDTVTGVYTRYSGLVKVIHCGETASGVGYGTLLG